MTGNRSWDCTLPPKDAAAARSAPCNDRDAVSVLWEQLQVTVVQHNPQSFSSTLHPTGGEGKGRDCGEAVCGNHFGQEHHQITSAAQGRNPCKDLCAHTTHTPVCEREDTEY